MKRALLFPGQGAHKVGMGHDLYDRYPEVRALYDQAQALVDFDLKALSFEGPEEELRRTDVSQPAIVVASLAALTALRAELGLASDAVIPGVVACLGMSLGEYTALCAAGVLNLGDTLRLVTLRGRFMQDCCEAQPSGMMTPLGTEREAIEKVIVDSGLCDEVGIANDNAPGQVVVSGSQTGLDLLAEKLKAAGVRRVMPLKVAGAYHSRLMAPAGEKLAEVLASVSFNPPKLTVLATVDAQPYKDPAEVAARLVQQVSGTVRFRESMAALVAMGVGEALELGPGGVLKGLVKKNAPSMEAQSAASLDEVLSLAESLRGSSKGAQG
jgi:[acyl-carrier-protein] S-malonyltransferase